MASGDIDTSAIGLKQGKRGVRMTFRRAIVTSVVQLEFDCEDVEAATAIGNWKYSVQQCISSDLSTVTSSHLELKGIHSDPTTLQSPHPLRLDMPYHITLAYRIDTSKRDEEEDARLAERLTAFIKMATSGSTSPASNTHQSSTASTSSHTSHSGTHSHQTFPMNGQLLLYPPVLSCYPDMTIFPTEPLYPINLPLIHLIRQHYAYEALSVSQVENPFKDFSASSSASSSGSSSHVATSAATPSESNEDKLPNCVIVILGRALENGKITSTLEKRLELGMDTYMAQLQSSSSNGSENDSNAQQKDNDGTHCRPVLLLSGGFTCRDGSNKSISEAQVMRDWLFERYGADKRYKEALKSIIMETDSLTTIENALYVRRKIWAEEPTLNHVSRLIIATTASHGPRSLFLFNAIFHPELNISKAPRKSKKSSQKKSIVSSSHLASSSYSFDDSPARVSKIHIELVTCPDVDPNDSGIEAWRNQAAWTNSLNYHLVTTNEFFKSSTPNKEYADLFSTVASHKPLNISNTDVTRILLTQHSLTHYVKRNRVLEVKLAVQALMSLTKPDLLKLISSSRSFAYEAFPPSPNDYGVMMSHSESIPPLGPLLYDIAVANKRPQVLDVLLELMPFLCLPHPSDSLFTFLPLHALLSPTGRHKELSIEMISSFIHSTFAHIPVEPSKDALMPISHIRDAIGMVGLNWAAIRERVVFRGKSSIIPPWEDIDDVKHPELRGRTWISNMWLGAIIFELFFVPSMALRLHRQYTQTKQLYDSLNGYKSKAEKAAKAERKSKKKEYEVRMDDLVPLYRFIAGDEMRHHSTAPYIFVLTLDDETAALKRIAEFESMFTSSLPYLPTKEELHKIFRHVELLIEGNETVDSSNGALKRVEQWLASIASQASLSHSATSQGSETVHTHVASRFFQNSSALAQALAKIRRGLFQTRLPPQHPEIFMSPVVFVVLSSYQSLDESGLKKELKMERDGRRCFVCNP